MRVTAIDDERSLGGPATAWGVLDGYDRPLLAGCCLLLPAAMGRSLPPRLCRPLVKSDASGWSTSMQLPGQMSAISQTLNREPTMSTTKLRLGPLTKT